jgi:hypothetical protein
MDLDDNDYQTILDYVEDTYIGKWLYALKANINLCITFF